MSQSPDTRAFSGLHRYDCSQSYRWNYEHAPSPDRSPREALCDEVAVVPGHWDFCGIPVASPLGIAAGPLLNGAWCLYYAELGFDVLTYKTVRSRQRDCYSLPNLLPVDCPPMTGSESHVVPRESMAGSWAVSFGMPSSEPEVWRRDVEWTRKRLPSGKALSVSVVGSVEPGWDLQRLADDYAICARWAVESGADCVEANFSCPNVSTCDGQLYQDPEQSALVASVIRNAIGGTPLIIKIGFIPPDVSVVPLLEALAPFVNGLSMTNSIAARVGRSESDLMFDGQQRGICGDAIRESSIAQVKRFADEIHRTGHPMKLIGVGGISSTAHLRGYLDAGAHACHLATAVMLDPGIGLSIRRELAS